MAEPVKLIAFYLPQFHEIAENNEWWGEGFTEWTNTRKAKALFEGHYQPREPLNDNYYNLLDPAARDWQAEIAEQFGIYGFCYYHYWFKGKMLLEKPFEQVLKTGQPNIPFCLSWANEPWTRNWDGGENSILMPQDYGNEADWEEHFYYLLSAFKDKRYIRIDNKPVFVIYRSISIPCCDEMLEFWNVLAKRNGLDGIFFVTTLAGFEIDNKNRLFQAQIEFEPMHTIVHYLPYHWQVVRKIKKTARDWLISRDYYLPASFLYTINYDSLWKLILKRKPPVKKTFPGAFIDWDNSARKKKEALIITGASPDKYETYMRKQICRAQEVYRSEFLFINAWNEWAEGAYLEPDQRFEYKYLEATRKALVDGDVETVSPHPR